VTVATSLQEHAVEFDVLLVDDSRVDAMLVKEALDSMGRVRLHVVRSGIDALAFLNRVGRYADAPRPQLVLLDINMPRMNGHEALARIRAEPQLAGLAVVMLTSSRAADDRDKATALGADEFVTKPVGYDAFAETVRSLVARRTIPPCGESRMMR
jgi:CheY-like chemotaxis protein